MVKVLICGIKNMSSSLIIYLKIYLISLIGRVFLLHRKGSGSIPLLENYKYSI